MHRVTPLEAAFVGYTGGGSRTLIDTIDDGQLMQEMKGMMMYGESRQKVEAPQNYGFSSVVRPATKGADGQIQDCAEGYMSFGGGNRSFPFCGVMDDRRYRPLGLKPGENSQYDDLGQMTLLRRTGLYLLSNDNAEDNQQQGQQGSSGGTTPTQSDGSSGGQSQPVTRMASLRHVEKSKQQRPSRGGSGQGASGGASNGGAAPSQRDDTSTGGQGQQQQDYKHEGDTVNHEVRVTKGKVEFYSGDNAVGSYDKASTTWLHTAGGDSTKSSKVDNTHSHIQHGDSTLWVDDSGCWSSKPIQIKTDPSATEIIKDPLLVRVEQLEARIKELEARLA